MIIDKGIRIKNIYYMLSYAFEFIKHTGYSNMDTEEFENIHDLFAAILAQGMAYQLKKGLYKEYVHKSDNLSTVRGKINITETIRNKILQRRIINCEFDELSENNIYNQIIKCTASLLLRHGNVEAKYKSRLKQSLLFFSNVDLKKILVDCTSGKILFEDLFNQICMMAYNSINEEIPNVKDIGKVLRKYKK